MSILLILADKGRLKVSDLYRLVPDLIGSGSPRTINDALNDLVASGFVVRRVRVERRDWVDYELSPLGWKVAEGLKTLIRALLEEEFKKRGVKKRSDSQPAV